MYILKFHEIYKRPIWGGKKIGTYKGKSLDYETVGESWEISAVEGDVSVVANGKDAGKSLSEILARDGARLVGQHVWDNFGTTFPLLIKFIDACDNLSIQVHPNDTLARQRHNTFGKTELWYIIDAEENAGLYSGFAQAITPDEYVERVANNTIIDVLQFHHAYPGDVYFLPSGRIHAIGKGILLAEIQQTSNITYRIYDYNRIDKDGNPRELHTHMAQDAIDYKLYDNLKTVYKPCYNQPVMLAECPYFTTNLLHINSECKRKMTYLDSFVIYMCMRGSATITACNNTCVELKQGETCLVPATISDVSLLPTPDCELLECYIK
ncbi:MAG: class I mannose-6-phosphate isomerase [Bacteroidaceae bacterium]|nr:class I mannose-6-phosphate isomerase [Bacteroidaceae bacterium]